MMKTRTGLMHGFNQTSPTLNALKLSVSPGRESEWLRNPTDGPHLDKWPVLFINIIPCLCPILPTPAHHSHPCQNFRNRSSLLYSVSFASLFPNPSIWMRDVRHDLRQLLKTGGGRVFLRWLNWWIIFSSVLPSISSELFIAMGFLWLKCWILLL